MFPAVNHPHSAPQPMDVQASDSHWDMPVGHGMRAPATTPRSPSPAASHAPELLGRDAFERHNALQSHMFGRIFEETQPECTRQLAGSKRAAEGEHVRVEPPPARGRPRAQFRPAPTGENSSRPEVELLVRLAACDDLEALQTFLPQRPLQLSGDERARLGHAAANNNAPRVLAHLLEVDLVQNDLEFIDDLWTVADLAHAPEAIMVLRRYKNMIAAMTAQSAQNTFG